MIYGKILWLVDCWTLTAILWLYNTFSAGKYHIDSKTSADLYIFITTLMSKFVELWFSLFPGGLVVQKTLRMRRTGPYHSSCIAHAFPLHNSAPPSPLKTPRTFAQKGAGTVTRTTRK